MVWPESEPDTQARGYLYYQTRRTTLTYYSHHPDDVEAALDASLKDLQMDYIDLYLIHWPSPFARGSSMFPKGDDGKTKVGDTDYVDVRYCSVFYWRISVKDSIDIQSHGKGPEDRQDSRYWYLQLL